MKRSGQCDFGHCEKPAEMLLVSPAEERPMCHACADFSIQLLPEFRMVKAEEPRKGAM